MAYPKEKIDEVLAYLDEGHSARDAERRFGVSRESAARWRTGPATSRSAGPVL